VKSNSEGVRGGASREETLPFGGKASGEDKTQGKGGEDRGKQMLLLLGKISCGFFCTRPKIVR